MQEKNKNVSVNKEDIPRSIICTASRKNFINSHKFIYSHLIRCQTITLCRGSRPRTPSDECKSSQIVSAFHSQANMPIFTYFGHTLYTKKLSGELIFIFGGYNAETVHYPAIG